MNNAPIFLFVLHLIALSTGFMAIISSVFLYTRHRKTVYLYFSMLSYSMLSKLMNTILKLYFENFPPENEVIIIIFKILKSAGVSVFLLVLPVFVNHVLNIKLTVIKKAVFLALSSIPLFLFALKMLFKLQIPYSSAITDAIFAAITVYCIFTVVINFKHITDRRLKNIFLTFLIISIAFFPLGVIDNIIGETSVQVPAFFIIINTLSIIFCLYYFHPQPEADNSRQRVFLYKKFGITNREKEIIDLIRSGCSNGDISEKITISTSTVEKHINSIYKKLNVGNRVQLINFIQTNL